MRHSSEYPVQILDAHFFFWDMLNAIAAVSIFIILGGYFSQSIHV